MKSKISITLENNLIREVDSIVDNVYVRNRSQAIEYLIKSSLGENKKAVILAGGQESKLKIGRGIYRPTAKLNGLHVIELAIKKLRENGFKEIFIVARHKVLTAIFEILKEGGAYGVKIHYQEEKVSRGTADSLRLLKGKISSSFLVVYADIVFDKINIDGLWNEHLKHRSVCTIMLTTSANPDQKGIVKVEGNRVIDFIQKPAKSDVYLVFSPIFAAEPTIFEYEGNSIEKDIFPELTRKGFLSGHLSSEKERHIHAWADLARK